MLLWALRVRDAALNMAPVWCLLGMGKSTLSKRYRQGRSEMKLINNYRGSRRAYRNKELPSWVLRRRSVCCQPIWIMTWKRLCSMLISLSDTTMTISSRSSKHAPRTLQVIQTSPSSLGIIPLIKNSQVMNLSTADINSIRLLLRLLLTKIMWMSPFILLKPGRRPSLGT